MKSKLRFKPVSWGKVPRIVKEALADRDRKKSASIGWFKAVNYTTEIGRYRYIVNMKRLGVRKRYIWVAEMAQK